MRKRWTEQEWQKVLSGLAEGLSYEEISKRMNGSRSPNQIKDRFHWLNVGKARRAIKWSESESKRF